MSQLRAECSTDLSEHGGSMALTGVFVRWATSALHLLLMLMLLAGV